MKPEPVKLKPKKTIADHFAVIEDPRIDRNNEVEKLFSKEISTGFQGI